MKPTILVIDDDEPILGLMKSILNGYGFEAITASTGADAIALAKSSLPAVILVDLRMPGMGGQEIIRALRADERLERTPIVVLSGAPVSQQELGAIRADAAIQKPFDVQHLIDRVGALARSGA